MSYPDIFTAISGDSNVTALLGSSPVRFYPFGEAPQLVAKPYAVWQIVGGGPENYISNLPDIDLFSLQIDVYAETATVARNATEVIRDSIESLAHITGWSGESRDSETNNYRVTFLVDWWVVRETGS